MSHYPNHEISCDGKVRYATWSQAKRSATTYNRWHMDENSSPIPKMPYHCTACGGYHIGTIGWSSKSRVSHRRKSTTSDEDAPISHKTAPLSRDTPAKDESPYEHP